MRNSHENDENDEKLIIPGGFVPASADADRTRRRLTRLAEQGPLPLPDAVADQRVPEHAA